MLSEQILADDLVNGTGKELLVDISSQFNAFRLDNNARLAALESPDQIQCYPGAGNVPLEQKV